MSHSHAGPRTQHLTEQVMKNRNIHWNLAADGSKETSWVTTAAPSEAGSCSDPQLQWILNTHKERPGLPDLLNFQKQPGIWIFLWHQIVLNAGIKFNRKWGRGRRKRSTSWKLPVWRLDVGTWWSSGWLCTSSTDSIPGHPTCYAAERKKKKRWCHCWNFQVEEDGCSWQ